MGSSNKLVSNTAIIYAKTIITILISLYSVRFVLDSLGEKDYGLFNVIGGLIAMLSFLNAAMAVSTQRYISHNLGAGNLENIKRIFANSFVLHLIIGACVVVLIEIIGLYFLNYKLKIDPDRLYIANIVFHFVVFSTFITILSVPYDAIINAYENMLFLAIMGIIESILKFGIALYLIISPFDRLLTYGFLMMAVTIVIALIKQVYTRKKYTETSGNYFSMYNKDIIKELTSFAGWNLFGSFSYVARNQGMAILLNFFFDTAINAAFGIANQVATQMNFFSSGMLQSLNPQIMKSEGANDRTRTIYLSLLACKIGFMLLAFIAIPCIIEMPSILGAWLKKVPDYTIAFSSLILVSAMINQLTAGLDSAIQAIGNIKRYMLFVGTLKLVMVPIAFIFLKLNVALMAVISLYAVFEFLGGCARLYVLNKEANISILTYIKGVILPLFPLIIVTVAIAEAIVYTWDYKYRWLFNIPLTSLSFIVLSYLLLLSKQEREMVNGLLLKIKAKFIK